MDEEAPLSAGQRGRGDKHYREACCGAVPAVLHLLNTRGAVPAEHRSPRGAHCHPPENGALVHEVHLVELRRAGGLPLRLWTDTLWPYTK